MQGPLWPRIYVKMGARSARSRVIPSGAQDSEYEPHSSVNEPVQSNPSVPNTPSSERFGLSTSLILLCVLASQTISACIYITLNPGDSTPFGALVLVSGVLMHLSIYRLHQEVALCYVMFGVWGYRAVVYLKRNDE